MNHYADNLAFNINCIDIDYVRPRLACAYLVEHNGKAAFIDCGTSRSVSRLLDTLSSRNLNRDDVEYVIPTHVHLDHAGGAGALMQALPNATLVVHPKGARHLIDPTRLVESTRQVYGSEKFAKLYGEIIPVDANRVLAAEDDSIIDLNGRMLEIAHTPGHARHHFCIFDRLSEGWFTGDTFGLSYPDIECNNDHYLLPTTTPVQFEPDSWIESLQHLLEPKPKRMYLTHFGAVEEVNQLASKLQRDIEAYVKIALSLQKVESRVDQLRQEIIRFTLNDLRALGNQQEEDTLMDLLIMDLTLNAQGLEVWLDRCESKRAK